MSSWCGIKPGWSGLKGDLGDVAKVSCSRSARPIYCPHLLGRQIEWKQELELDQVVAAGVARTSSSLDNKV